MVQWNIKKTLDLACMQVASHNAVRPRRGEHIGNELGCNGYAWSILSVLTCIAKVGDYRTYFVGAGSFCSINHQAQFEQVVTRRVGALDDEYRATTNGFVKTR